MPFEPGTIEAFGLYLVRTSTFVLAAPLLGLSSGFSGYKIALIAMLALVLFVAAGAPAIPVDGLVPFAALGLREVLIGLFLGFVGQLAVLAVRVGGTMIGHEMGFAMASQVDPESGASVPLIARVYENLFLLGLLSVDGHHWLLRALDSSFERAPVGRLELAAGVPVAAQLVFTEMFAAGISFAAPIMVLLVLVSILVGLLSRAVPQLNVLEVSFTVRIVLAFVTMLLFAPLLGPSLEHVFVRFEAGLDAALDALGG